MLDARNWIQDTEDPMFMIQYLWVLAPKNNNSKNIRNRR